jgi:hypothetical protein
MLETRLAGGEGGWRLIAQAKVLRYLLALLGDVEPPAAQPATETVGPLRWEEPAPPPRDRTALLRDLHQQNEAAHEERRLQSAHEARVRRGEVAEPMSPAAARRWMVGCTVPTLLVATALNPLFAAWLIFGLVTLAILSVGWLASAPTSSRREPPPPSAPAA